MLVVCNGGRRSGSTLQFNITRSLLELTGEGRGGDFYEPGQLSDRDVRLMAQSDDWLVIKTHHVEPAILRTASSARCLIFFTYRDLRDVAVSAQRFWRLSWDETLAVLRQSLALSEALEEHPITLAQRYEFLVSQTRDAIVEIATWLEIPLTDTLVDAVLDSSSAEQVQNAIASIPVGQRTLARTYLMLKSVPQPLRRALRKTSVGSQIRERLIQYANVVEPSTHVHPRHMSSSLGEPGTWRGALSVSQIIEIENTFGDWLVDHDYELTTA